MGVRAAVPVTAVVAAVALLPAPAARAGCGGVKVFHARGHARRPPLVIGDSVTLGAGDALARAGFDVDARGCRQEREGLGVLRARRHAHRLPALVVVALGTNGSLSGGGLDAMLRVLGAARTLALVTPRKDGGGADADARVVRRFAHGHRDRVVVLDWVAVHGRAGWFAGDGIHLGPAGAAGFARLCRTALPYAVGPLVARFGHGHALPRRR